MACPDSPCSVGHLTQTAGRHITRAGSIENPARDPPSNRHYAWLWFRDLNFVHDNGCSELHAAPSGNSGFPLWRPRSAYAVALFVHQSQLSSLVAEVWWAFTS
jgi:hypothetical protein